MKTIRKMLVDVSDYNNEYGKIIQNIKITIVIKEENSWWRRLCNPRYTIEQDVPQFPFSTNEFLNNLIQMNANTLIRNAEMIIDKLNDPKYYVSDDVLLEFRNMKPFYPPNQGSRL